MGEEYDRLKRDLQADLINALDFDRVGEVPRELLEERYRTMLTEQVDARQLPLNRSERERIITDVLDNILGLGPLEPLLRDPDVSDIVANGPHKVYVERKGRLSKSDVKFHDDTHMMQVIERIVSGVGRRIDEQNPMVDARMRDGSRFNAIIPPLALDGPCISIRRFGADPIMAEDLVALGSCPRPVLEVLRGAVRSRLNCFISGGTGSGKTTFLNVMSGFISEGERIITIEDSAELQLQQRHVIRLETRPENLEGKGEVTPRDLLKHSLRMRPDRIIMGEIRGAEATDMLTAMNVGCDGSMSTVHANSPRDALARLETMVGLGMKNMTDKTIRETIARALDLIIQLDRLPDGNRRLMGVTEVTGMEGDVITTQDIFVFEQETVDETGTVRGAYRATGVRPQFSAKLAANGIRLAPELFAFEQRV